MRILHVTPYYRDAWAYGGIPRVVAALARAQSARGHAVTVWTTDAGTRDRLPRPAGARPWRGWESVDDDGVDVRVFPNLSNRLAYSRQGFVPIGLRTHAAHHASDFDVAHVHACRNLAGAWTAAALARATVPYVVAPNGTAPIIERQRLAKRAFDVVFGRTMLERAARIVAVTEAERRDFMSSGIEPARIAVVGNPLELREYERLPPRGYFRAARAVGDGPLVLFLGKLTPRKRLDVVIDAFARLPGVDARLVVAGNDMGAGDAARRLANRLGVSSRVVFTGLLQGEDRLAALADADVVVYPSEHEIFGLVPLEALLCGTPVVVADDSGCGEVIREVGGGGVVPVGDAAALAAAVAAVLRAPAAWSGRVAAARDAVARRFGSSAVAAALDEVYGGIIG